MSKIVNSWGGLERHPKKKKKKDEAYIRPLGNVAYFDSWKRRKRAVQA